jgi:hypothetical protein
MRKCEWCEQENSRKITSKFCSKECYKKRWAHYKATNPEYNEKLRQTARRKHRISVVLNPDGPLLRRKRGTGRYFLDDMGYARIWYPCKYYSLDFTHTFNLSIRGVKHFLTSESGLTPYSSKNSQVCSIQKSKFPIFSAAII